MSQRFQVTKWLWFLLALYSGPSLSPVRCVSVKAPPKTPSTVEAQAKFFQDFFSVQLSPYKIEFGHVCEDPNTWEQRYEKKDYKNHRDMGKVRWGDKKGGYGEHYWDLNHAGHAGNHGGDDYSGNNHDDGSYHDHNDHSPSSSYDGPSDHSDHSYGSDDYDPEKSSYEENGRAKRAHPKIKPEKIHKQHHNDEEEPEEEEVRPRNHKHKHQQQETSSHEENDSDDEEEEEEEKVYKKSKRPHSQHRQKQETEDETPEPPPPKEAKKKVVLVVQEKENPETNQYVPQVANRQVEYTKYVPYEGGAGVRQHHVPEVAAAASVPRLFLEPTTGHVVDRATGQAYVLQPIAALGYN
ncbi:hypothetical protein evm_008250 [Chilo suppressalis]|nr:hypothetical protein evm_008250 [Chilo suppressalis]